MVLTHERTAHENSDGGDVSPLVCAIEAAASGLVVMDPAIVRSPRPMSGPGLGALTPRQLRVLQLMAEGHDNSSIADALVVSEKSVENVINALFRRLDIPKQGSIHRRVEAALAYAEEAQRR